jgi:signal transduction histidine kinase
VQTSSRCELDEPAELTVYRLVQEALTNIGKYARPGRSGSPASARRQPRRSRGARRRHRLRPASNADGGRLQVQSAPGEGTRISAVLPLLPA